MCHLSTQPARRLRSHAARPVIRSIAARRASFKNAAALYRLGDDILDLVPSP
jgi:hypothetical protein